MTTAANQSGYGTPGVGSSPWGSGGGPGAPWGYPGVNQGGYPAGPAAYWHWRHANRPLWIVAMILGFMFWWPVGLVVLLFTIGSRRMGCWGYGPRSGFDAGWQGGPVPPWVGWKRQWKQQMKEWCRGQAQGQAQTQAQPSSGNRAFDEYRAETLRRLEEEQKEFGTFLDRLRFAKDKAEFDQFMAELRQRPPAPPEQAGQSPQV